MRAIAPRIEGIPEVTLAEDQHEYKAITAASVKYGDGSRAWVTRWRLSPEEREAIDRGSDVYVEILGDRMVPLAVTIGAPQHLTNSGAMTDSKQAVEPGELDRRWRKKPAVVEAMQFLGTKENFDALWAWACPSDDTTLSPIHCGNHPETGEDDYGRLHVETAEGPLRATIGDWIIRGVVGEFYPCKPDIFAATYEPASIQSERSAAARSVPQESERESEVMRALHDFRDAGGSAERVVAAIRGLMAPRSEGIERDAGREEITPERKALVLDKLYVAAERDNREMIEDGLRMAAELKDWKDAALQAQRDLRAIEGAAGNPPLLAGGRWAGWTSPANTIRLIDRLLTSSRETGGTNG